MEHVAAYHTGPQASLGWEHNSNRFLTRFVPPIPDLWLCYTHANCVCNQLISVTNRVVGETPVPTNEGLRSIRLSLKKQFLHSKRFIAPWSLERVLSTYNDQRKKIYERAYDSLKTEPITPRDARISAFCKAEKFDPAAKVNPDPRMIQSRSPRYNLVLGQYLKPLEKVIYRKTSRYGGRMFAKGLTASQRAELCVRKWALFKNPVCFSLDASRWDKHVHLKVLRLEHEVYKFLVNEPGELYQLLKWQERNKCSTRDGVRYTVCGGRMSGDLNTALGNCILMTGMIHAAMETIGVKYEILDDGDDCLLFLERADAAVCEEALPRLFLTYGQELKLENRAERLEDIVFCQSKIVFVSGKPQFVRNWRKVLSHGCAGVKHWNNPKLVRPMMSAVGSCELALNAGVPIIQAYAVALRRMGRDERLKWLDVEAGLAIRVKVQLGVTVADVYDTVEEQHINYATRLSFEKAFGVPPWEQVLIERRLEAWDIDTEVSLEVPVELDHHWDQKLQDWVTLPSHW